MPELTITSAALILVVLILRHFLKGKISLRLQYALWALVLLRLLVPVNLPATPVSVLNALHIGEGDVAAAQLLPLDVPEPSASAVAPDNQAAVQNAPGTAFGWEQALRLAWYAGIAAVGLCLLISNLSFMKKLKKAKTEFPAEDYRLKVYVADCLPSSCLYGLFSPAVYITPDVAADKEKLGHVLAHEYCHYRHGDHIWSVLRSLCLAVYWFNPLVWLAAAVSRRDAELACDEGTILRLGEENRTDYGRTLIGLTCQNELTCQKRSTMELLRPATTMSDSKKGIQERIALIAKKPKTAARTLVAVILVLALAAGGTFTAALAAPSSLTTGDFEGMTQVDTALKDGRGGYLLPLRTVWEAYGYTVSWDGDTRTVRVQSHGVDVAILTVGSSVMAFIGDWARPDNEQGFDLGGPVVIINDRAYVPAENFGAYMTLKINADTLGIYMPLPKHYTVYDGKNPLSKEELEKAEWLTIINVDSLDFLRAAVNLTRVKVGVTDTMDTGQYAGTVSGDIGVLAGMTKLEEISLTSSNVTGDIAALGGLENLEIIYLNQTKVTGDFGALASLTKLKMMALAADGVTGDLGSLGERQFLESVFLTGEGITGDIAALGGLTNLTGISLTFAPNVTGDISVLKDRDMTSVILYGTGVDIDLNVIGGFENLLYLGLSSSGVHGDIGALGGLSDLVQLSVASPNVTGDIGDLGGLKNLMALSFSLKEDMASSAVTGDIGTLAGLTKLNYINLSYTNVSGDIASLAGLSDLMYLLLAYTGVSGDFGSLAGLTKLSVTDFTGTNVTGVITTGAEA